MRLKWCILIALIAICIATGGCTSASPAHTVPSFKDELEAIAVPPMNRDLLDSSVADQLRWLASIYQFELDTLRAKTSGLTEDDITLVQNHLSQVYGSDEIKQLIDGFYQYNEEDQSYYVPDGSWFTYNEKWPSSELKVIERTNDFAQLELVGVDDYGGAPRTIHISLQLHEHGHFTISGRSYL